MWAQIITVIALATICLTDKTLPAKEQTALQRKYSENTYNGPPPNSERERQKIYEFIPPPLTPDELKCMMSDDKYCTKSLLKSKHVLIRSFNDGCKKCSKNARRKASLVASAMIAHHSVAWNLFIMKNDDLRAFLTS